MVINGGYVDLPDSFVKDTLQISLREGRAFEVFLCFDLFGNCEGLFIRNWLHLLCTKIVSGSLILSQIQFGSHKNYGDIGRVMFDFWEPLCNKLIPVRVEGICYQRTFALTLSKDGGLTIEKHMRKTSVCGYDKGRSLS